MPKSTGSARLLWLLATNGIISPPRRLLPHQAAMALRRAFLRG